MTIKKNNFVLKHWNWRVIILGWFLLIASITPLDSVQAIDKKQNGHEIGVNGFLDEDGDGFNDLLPDSDGDGVPDALDPDFRGHGPDSANGYGPGQCMPDSGGPMHDRWSGEMGPHGEPGMYGPGDTTGHGGMHGGGGYRGGMGPRGGMNPDDSAGYHKNAPGLVIPQKEGLTIEKGLNNPGEENSVILPDKAPGTGVREVIQKESIKR